VNIVKGKHTLVAGGEYLDHRTLTHHASTNPRGGFTFNGQYTGNSFADYLLGLVQSAAANVPLAAFGVAHAPYSALYVDDTWRIHSNVTVNLGVRWDYWWEKALCGGRAPRSICAQARR
jgi:Outer membrane receptor for monomeric catechols